MLVCLAQESFKAGQCLGIPAETWTEEMAFIFLFIKVLAVQHMDERAKRFFFKCCQVNPRMKQDEVKAAAQTSENSSGLRNNS